MKNRSIAAFGLLAVTAMLLSACGALSGGALGTKDNPLVWVLVPSQDTGAVLTGAEDIAAALEEETGLVMTPLVSTDFTGAVEAMCSNEAHMGALNTFNYLVAAGRDCAEVGVASVRFGSTFYTGQVIREAGDETAAFLETFGEELRFLFITSEVAFDKVGADAFRSEELPELAIGVEAARGNKCERCWNFTEDVGQDAHWPQICGRCSEAVRRILSEAGPA